MERLRYVPKGQGSWKFVALKTEKSIDDPGEVFTWSEAFETSHWKLFHESLKDHRTEVMDKILAQEFGLSVSPK